LLTTKHGGIKGERREEYERLEAAVDVAWGAMSDAGCTLVNTRPTTLAGKCGLNYQATQEQSSDQSSGSFDCKNCKTNVLKWSGVYDYSRWTRPTGV
jgi:hypothetical protein